MQHGNSLADVKGHSLSYLLFQWRHPRHNHTHIFRLPFKKVTLIRLFLLGACANMLFAKGNVSAITTSFCSLETFSFYCCIPCKKKKEFRILIKYKTQTQKQSILKGILKTVTMALLLAFRSWPYCAKMIIV